MRFFLLSLTMSLIVAACEVDIPDFNGPSGTNDSISVSGTVRGLSGAEVQGIGVFLQYDPDPGWGWDTVFTGSQGGYSAGPIAVFFIHCGDYSLVFFEESSQQTTKLSNCGVHTINIIWDPGD